MADYRPTPYIAALADRLSRLDSPGREMSAGERKEARRLARSIRWAKWHWNRSQTDPAYCEARRARAREHQRRNQRAEASA